MKTHHTKYECVADGCLAGTYGMDDLPPETVLAISRPGWYWDGERMLCPTHVKDAAYVPAP